MTYTLEIKDEFGQLKVLTATAEQEAIIDYALAHIFVPEKLLLLVNALAGSAKTSTLRFLCKYLPVMPILSIAFNKRIVDEMKKVLPAHVRPATANSIGHGVVSALVGRKLTLETKKNANIVKEMIDTLPRAQRRDAYDLFGDITKAISTAKSQGYVPKSVQFGKSLISQEDFFGGLDEAPDPWFIDFVDRALILGIRQAYAGLIDFDDQIYISTLFGGSFPQFPLVLGDEGQDFSPLNHEMIKKLYNKHLAVVGDPWQSIYAFRGAVTSSMSRLRDHFDMHEMTLSVSFRCARAIVRNAQWRVPHMQWPEWAVEGKVAALLEWSGRDIPDNAAIICRNNAPLLSVALSLLKSGRGVHLVGTDLGPQLIKALKKFGDGTVDALKMPREKVHEAINAWQVEKLSKARNEGAVMDKAECLRVFADFGPTLGAAIAYAEHIFSQSGPIQLLSGHKSKGLEWDTVYHLDPHRIPSPWSREGEALEQEHNVRYVIETRAKRELYFIEMDGFAEEPIARGAETREEEEAAE